MYCPVLVLPYCLTLPYSGPCPSHGRRVTEAVAEMKRHVPPYRNALPSSGHDAAPTHCPALPVVPPPSPSPSRCYRVTEAETAMKLHDASRDATDTSRAAADQQLAAVAVALQAVGERGGDLEGRWGSCRR